MNKFLIGVAYSSGPWARMLNSADDRTAAVRRLLASLGGSLEQVYWMADMRGAFAIAELPDTTIGAATAAAMLKTGAFTNVEVHELLTQEQLTDVRHLAAAAAESYLVPGEPAVE
jgi:uncharacterized protein with GYD domain